MRHLPSLPRRAFHRAIAAALLAGAACLAQTDPSAAVAPREAESGIAFRVTVSGKTTLCNPQFSRRQALSGNGTLDLSVMAVNDPVAKCTAGEHDYHTDFEIPALKAGKYAVTIALNPACLYETPMCKIAVIRESAGDLVVRDSASLAYAIRPKRVAAGKPFELFLTGKDFTCGNVFSDLSAAVDGNVVRVRFTDKPNPAALCPAVLKDYGPTFQVPALAAGTYQVYALRSPYCSSAGPCPLALVAPQLSGALAAEGADAIAPSSKALSPAAAAGRAVRVDARGGKVTAAWKGGSRDLTGKGGHPGKTHPRADRADGTR
ncbi:MAG: hypothetical protein JWP91_1492 [Fibrobacteres bacterium]|nr:hypothetical protein [Fibrobacterota bacterium]